MINLKFLTKRKYENKGCGEWIYPYDITRCYCSNCKVRYYETTGLSVSYFIFMQKLKPISPPKYCPNCGFKNKK